MDRPIPACGIHQRDLESPRWQEARIHYAYIKRFDQNTTHIHYSWRHWLAENRKRLSKPVVFASPCSEFRRRYYAVYQYAPASDCKVRVNHFNAYFFIFLLLMTRVIKNYLNTVKNKNIYSFKIINYNLLSVWITKIMWVNVNTYCDFRSIFKVVFRSCLQNFTIFPITLLQLTLCHCIPVSTFYPNLLRPPSFSSFRRSATIISLAVNHCPYGTHARTLLQQWCQLYWYIYSFLPLFLHL